MISHDTNFILVYFSWLFLIINTEVRPPENNPKVNDVPIKKPIGRSTVLLNSRSKLYFFSRFWDPRQRNKISNIAVEMFRVKSFNLKNI